MTPREKIIRKLEELEVGAKAAVEWAESQESAALEKAADFHRARAWAFRDAIREIKVIKL